MNAREFEEAWFSRWQRAGPAVRNELRVTGQRLLQLSLTAMRDEIYSKPEDLSAAGRPKWVRTANLLLSEHLEDDGADRVVLVNTARYAHRRHESNKPGFPYRVNANRTAHWRDDAMKRLMAERPEALARLALLLLRGS